MSDIPPFSVRDFRILPPFAGAFCLLMLLLFFRELTQPIRDYLVPSLVAYVLGASFVSYLQMSLWSRKKANLSTCMYVVLVLLHLFCILAFLVYNFWRGSL